MTAALELAKQGFEVHLVEKEKELGGHLRTIHYLLEKDEDPKEEAKRHNQRRLWKTIKYTST